MEIKNSFHQNHIRTFSVENSLSLMRIQHFIMTCFRFFFRCFQWVHSCNHHQSTISWMLSTWNVVYSILRIELLSKTINQRKKLCPQSWTKKPTQRNIWNTGSYNGSIWKKMFSIIRIVRISYFVVVAQKTEQKQWIVPLFRLYGIFLLLRRVVLVKRVRKIDR